MIGLDVSVALICQLFVVHMHRWMLLSVYVLANAAWACRCRLCNWKMRKEKVIWRPPLVFYQLLIHWWYMDRSTRLLIRLWKVYNDLKLHCVMTLRISHVQCMLRSGAFYPFQQLYPSFVWQVILFQAARWGHANDKPTAVFLSQPNPTSTAQSWNVCLRLDFKV